MTLDLFRLDFLVAFYLTAAAWFAAYAIYQVGRLIHRAYRKRRARVKWIALMAQYHAEDQRRMQRAQEYAATQQARAAQAMRQRLN